MSKTKRNPIRAHPPHQPGGRPGAQNEPRVHFASKNKRSNKPFRMISLRQIRSQLPWIDILTKKHRGWGYVLSSYPVRREALSPATKLESAPQPCGQRLGRTR